MKKLLVIFLVLGMASLVHAATCTLTLSSPNDTDLVAIDTVIKVQLKAELDTSGNTYLKVIKGIDFTNGSGTNICTLGSWNTTAGAGAHTDGTQSGNSIVDAYLSTTDEMDEGTVLYEFLATIKEDGTFGMADVGDVLEYGVGFPPPAYGSVVLNGLAVTIIPEPMTIMLLGLGGLFLRRRK